jgi:hypothetical protein
MTMYVNRPPAAGAMSHYLILSPMGPLVHLTPFAPPNHVMIYRHALSKFRQGTVKRFSPHNSAPNSLLSLLSPQWLHETRTLGRFKIMT